MDTPDDAATPGEGARPSRWFRRALPVTGIVLALVGLLSLVSPGFRDQVRLSVSRQPQPYVELYFAKSTAGAPAACTRSATVVAVRFVLASHLGKRETVSYQVTLDPTTKGLRTQRRTGSIALATDRQTEVPKAFRLPRREGYTVSVVLPDRDQHLRAHCPGSRS